MNLPLGRRFGGLEIEGVIGLCGIKPGVVNGAGEGACLFLPIEQREHRARHPGVVVSLLSWLETTGAPRAVVLVVDDRLGSIKRGEKAGMRGPLQLG